LYNLYNNKERFEKIIIISQKMYLLHVYWIINRVLCRLHTTTTTTWKTKSNV